MNTSTLVVAVILGIVGFVVVAVVRPAWIRQPLVVALPIALGAANALIFRTNAEDAFITYRYSLQLAEGHGPVFNVGERVEGYSNFLWMVTLAAAHQVSGADTEHIARALGLVTALATIGVTWFLIRRLTDDDRVLATAATLVLACSGVFAAYATSGLETPLFALLAVLVVLTTLRRQPLVTGALVALLVMTRPDGLVFVLPVAIWLTLPTSTGDAATFTGRRTALLLYALGLGVIAVPWTIWRVAYYGYLVPNPLAAKNGGIGVFDQLHEGLHYFNRFVLDSWPLLVVPAALVAAALLLGWRSRLRADDWMLVVTIVLASLLAVAAGGDWMPAARLFSPLMPLLIAAFAMSWSRAFSRATERSRVSFAVVCGITAVLMLVASFSVYDLIPRVRAWRDEVEALSAQGRWFHDHLPPGTTIATFANGALSYRAGTGIRVIDMLGLTDEHIARHGKRLAEGPVGHRAHDEQYVVRRRPAVVIFSGSGNSTAADCGVAQPFDGEYIGHAFTVPFANSTGSYVNLYVRRDVEGKIVRELLQQPGVRLAC